MRFILDLAPEDDDTGMIRRVFDCPQYQGLSGLNAKVTTNDGQVAYVFLIGVETTEMDDGDTRPILIGNEYDDDEYEPSTEMEWTVMCDDVKEVVVR